MDLRDLQPKGLQKTKLFNSHPLNNFEIQKYYQIEPRFNGVYPGDNLLNKIKDKAYVINLDGYSNIGSRWKFF